MGTRYAALNERSQQKSQVSNMKDTLSNPVAWEKIQGKDAFKRQLKQEEERLAKITPPSLQEGQRDRCAKRLTVLEKAMVNGDVSKGIPAMPSQKEMWDTPAGSIGKHTAWEKFWKEHSIDEKGNVHKTVDGYGAIFQWKDARRALMPDREEEDPDIANTDTFRPTDGDGSSKFIDYASMTMAPLANLSYQEVDEMFPGREPSMQEMKVRAGELEKKRAELKEQYESVESDESIETQSTCQAVTSSGKQCKREAKVGTSCGIKSHIAQLGE